VISVSVNCTKIAACTIETCNMGNVGSNVSLVRCLKKSFPGRNLRTIFVQQLKI